VPSVSTPSSGPRQSSPVGPTPVPLCGPAALTDHARSAIAAADAVASAALAAACAGASAAVVADAAAGTAQVIRKACMSSGPMYFDLAAADAATLVVDDGCPRDGPLGWVAVLATADLQQDLSTTTAQSPRAVFGASDISESVVTCAANADAAAGLVPAMPSDDLHSLPYKPSDISVGEASCTDAAAASATAVAASAACFDFPRLSRHALRPALAGSGILWPLPAWHRKRQVHSQ
jgi:hypothetical protein